MTQGQFLPTKGAADSKWLVTQQWGPLGLLDCRQTCAVEDDEEPWVYTTEHTLGLFLSPRPLWISHRQASRSYTGFYNRGDLLITPVNTTLVTQSEGVVEMVQIRLQDAFLRQVAAETLGQNEDRVELMQAFQTRDPQIEAIARMLQAELRQAAAGSRLYVDSLANVLAVHLLRQHATARSPLPTYPGGLPPRQLRQVLDYLDAHLATEITLATLAELVDISPFHFSRLFKQSLGVSPYQYLLQQRIERAKRLLKQTDQPITTIALACGFNSHSHLGRKFRQLTGMTPKTFRLS
ncbi:helix-turn-helix domain-containing protein [Nodosilinea sp. AN01ver1]|uniref:helix-turn-helix domain-containing protein n=1 Tax=Nodosilinea sp. AN01ver1 TaxID=3423362 RepID=UPI003D323387